MPSVATLEMLAVAFEVPLYRLFYESEELPTLPKLAPRRTLEELAKEPGKEGQDAKFQLTFPKHLAKLKKSDHQTFLPFARKPAASKG